MGTIEDKLTLEVIAHIRSDFPAKFGIPRQSGLADTKAEILFEPKYRNPEAFRGLEEFPYMAGLGVLEMYPGRMESHCKTAKAWR